MDMPANMRGLYEAVVVEVYEGEGKEGDPGRIVQYVYTKNGGFIGVIDAWKQSKAE